MWVEMLYRPIPKPRLRLGEMKRQLTGLTYWLWLQAGFSTASFLPY